MQSATPPARGLSSLRRLLLWWILFVACLSRASATLSPLTSGRETRGPFCMTPPPMHENFLPNNLPRDPLAPWVYDAFIQKVNSKYVIEVVTADPGHCYFNTTQWKEMCRLFPKVSKRFANCLDENIIVYSKPSKPPMDVSMTISCRIGVYNSTSDRSRAHKFQSRAMRFTGKSLNSGIVRCLIPLEYVTNALYNSFWVVKLIYSPPMSHSYHPTQWFPVCPLEVNSFAELNNFAHHSRDVNSNINSNSKRYEFHAKDRAKSTSFSNTMSKSISIHEMPKLEAAKKYRLSLCTVTKRIERENIVEWLEYHLLQGVQHFFIYNAATGKKSREAAQVLKDYMDEGTVSLIPWNFEGNGCVKEFGSVRPFVYVEPNKTQRHTFQPPPNLSVLKGYISCYSRFRRTSDWLIVADDDEFFAMNYSYIPASWKAKREGRREGGGGGDRQIDNIKPLRQLIAYMEDEFPSIATVAFLPIFASTTLRSSTFSQHSVSGASTIYYPPRLGSAWKATKGPKWETKLIARTDIIGSINVHCVGIIDNPLFKDTDNYTSKRTLLYSEGSMFHYKSDWGSTLQVYGRESQSRVDNKDSYVIPSYLKQHIWSYFGYNSTFERAMYINYDKRMRSSRASGEGWWAKTWKKWSLW